MAKLSKISWPSRIAVPAVLTALVAGLIYAHAEEKKADANWWSLQPVQRTEVPLVPNQKWARNPIDAFVLATLKEHKLTPSNAANRATLIRRLSYDLTGLPLERVAGVPAVCLDRSGGGRSGGVAISLSEDDVSGCSGKAVLIRTEE